MFDILDVNKGPCDIVALSDDFGPGCLLGESSSAVEIPNCWFYAGELVDVVYCFHCIWADVVENFKVGEHFSCLGDGLYGFKRLGSGGSIE